MGRGTRGRREQQTEEVERLLTKLSLMKMLVGKEKAVLTGNSCKYHCLHLNK